MTWLRRRLVLYVPLVSAAFLTFWRQYGELLLGSASYHEIAPHLVLMAFLHRVVNGGGSLERAYAIGRGRMDLCLRDGRGARPRTEGLAHGAARPVWRKVWRNSTNTWPVWG